MLQSSPPGTLRQPSLKSIPIQPSASTVKWRIGVSSEEAQTTCKNHTKRSGRGFWCAKRSDLGWSLGTKTVVWVFFSRLRLSPLVAGVARFRWRRDVFCLWYVNICEMFSRMNFSRMSSGLSGCFWKRFLCHNKRVSVDIFISWNYIFRSSQPPFSSSFPKNTKSARSLAFPPRTNHFSHGFFPAFKNPSWMGDHLPGCLRYTIDVGDPEDRGGHQRRKPWKKRSFKHQFCHRKMFTIFGDFFYVYIL